MLFLFAVIVFLITTPTIILKPAAFTDSISELINRGPGTKYSFIFDYSIFISVIENFIIVTDPFLTILMILGLIIPFRKRWDREMPMIIIVVIFSIFFGALSSRQLIAVLPLTSGAQRVFHLDKRIDFIHKPVWVTFLILWIIFALGYNSAGIFLRNNDPRTYFFFNNKAVGTTTNERKMIVVLPFENSGSPQDEYFADGITEEITSRLSGLSGLGVIARTSAKLYKNVNKPLNQIAEELGVGYVLFGTIRWEKTGEGSRVKINPELIRVNDGVQIWSEPFEAPSFVKKYSSF